ncbi:hypothetical protein MA16_Dca007450 [Dendrobium catenatum]|uniref:Uncharacterized protein n=1 Tax=Dendrobium catenatum TaxID=906689 RepID=A0A2I0WAQ0_9ASPA|nr:hypothetical protein MA16_Dca007450 [Dendrobium catenatum]
MKFQYTRKLNETNSYNDPYERRTVPCKQVQSTKPPEIGERYNEPLWAEIHISPTTTVTKISKYVGYKGNPMCRTGFPSHHAREKRVWAVCRLDMNAEDKILGSRSYTLATDLGPLGDYSGSPFLPSDSDILLDSPEQDDIVEEYFADTNNNGPCSQSDEEKT